MCAIERDKLAAVEGSDSREALDSIADQRKRVAEQCPRVDTTNVWLLQMVWARPAS